MGNFVWELLECRNSTTDNQTRKSKLLEKYVDDTISAVKVGPKNLHLPGKNLHKTLEFTMKNMDEKLKLGSLLIAVYDDEQREVFCGTKSQQTLEHF